MDAQRAEFLTSMIDILERLHQTCVNRGEPLLASVLAIAKGEAEDALRHAEELAALARDAREDVEPDDLARRRGGEALLRRRRRAGGAAVERYADEGYAADARGGSRRAGYDADDYERERAEARSRASAL